MYMMKKLPILTSIILLNSFISSAQDIHFSQFQQAPLTYNPGMLGSFDGDLAVGLNWKDQWRGINKSFQTFSFSFEHNILKNKIKNTYFTYGILAYRDIAGEVSYGTTNVLGNIGATIKVSENSKLTAGLQAGWGSKGLDANALRWGTQYDGLNYDPSISSGESTAFSPVSYIDAGIGLSYHYHKKASSFETNDQRDLKIGFGLSHITRPQISYFENSDESLPMKLAVHGSYYWGIKNSNWGIEPAFAVLVQSLHREVLLGGNMKYFFSKASDKTGYHKRSCIFFGVQNRISSPFDAVIPQAGVELQDFRISFSYDVNVSKLSAASMYRGGFEISLRYIHPDKYYYLNPEKTTPSL